jgi:hypothetical protein
MPIELHGNDRSRSTYCPLDLRLHPGTHNAVRGNDDQELVTPMQSRLDKLPVDARKALAVLKEESARHESVDYYRQENLVADSFRINTGMTNK